MLFRSKNKGEIGKLLFDANLAEYVQLKDDGSLRDFPAGHFTHELVVCVPISKRRDILKSVCDVLAVADSKVNKTCGLHVHLDMRYHDRYEAFSNLVSSQNILYQMVPQSRRDNTYCKKTTTKDYQKARNQGRYVGINPQSFSKHGTIEVRLHSGTTNFTKIINFVDILIAVGYNETKIVRAASTIAGFVKQHNLTSDIKAYIEQRIALFGGSSTAEEAA